MTACTQENSARTDFDLVELTKQGDQTAFDELVSRHYHRCLSLATFILRDRTGASDQVQEAFWRAFERLDQYQGTSEFSSWLHRIVVNECLMVLRAGRRTRLIRLDGDEGGMALQLPAYSQDPEFDLAHSQMAEIAHREIRRLPPLLRNVVVLRDVQGLAMTDVAARLGVTVAAAKSRLLRARLEVRSRIERSVGNSGVHMCRSSVRNLPARSVRSTSFV